MVQLQGSRKRRAEPAAAARAPAAAAAVKEEEEEEGFSEGNGLLHKRVKAMPPPPPPPPQDMYCDVLDEPSPLGLRLKKSPSLVDLIQMKLSQSKSAVDNSISGMRKKKEVKSGDLTSSERLKASNFPASVLKIGTWEYISRYEGDLVAKCYFAKHKLVWEVLDDGLKSKIEIQWSDIAALKATCPEDGQGTLDLVLARPPIFFKETDPQPRKHTLWQAASDFTGGQASLSRRHTLQGPSTLLSKNFEKLIQCDLRLNQLSQQSNIILETPDFERCSIFENPKESKDCLDFNGMKYESEMSIPKFADPVSPCAFSSPSKRVGQPEFHAQPINIDFHVSGVPQEPKISSWQNQLKVPGMRASMSVDDLVSHLGNCITEHRTTGNPPLPNNEEQSKEVLEEIVEYLFTDTQGPPASDDKYLMARVDSFYSLLEKDTEPCPITKSESTGCGNKSAVEVNSDGSDEELNSETAGKTAVGSRSTEPPAISRKDSFGDLMLNLPRIASIPQFLFDIPEDSSDK
ncbi:hypothetical protein ACP4OV_000426 [Aristida adscensionis]